MKDPIVIATGQTLRFLGHERTVTKIAGEEVYFDDGDRRHLTYLERHAEIVGVNLSLLERVARALGDRSAPAGLRPFPLPKPDDDALVASWGTGLWTVAKFTVDVAQGTGALTWRLTITIATGGPAATLENLRAAVEIAEFCVTQETRFAVATEEAPRC